MCTKIPQYLSKIRRKSVKIRRPKIELHNSVEPATRQISIGQKVSARYKITKTCQNKYFIHLKYVPPKLPSCKTSLGVKFGLKSGKSSNIRTPLLSLSTDVIEVVLFLEGDPPVLLSALLDEGRFRDIITLFVNLKKSI